MPNPTEGQRESDEFEAIWDVIKSWDVEVPEFYDGYCNANGSHVVLILNALEPLRSTPSEERGGEIRPCPTCDDGVIRDPNDGRAVGVCGNCGGTGQADSGEGRDTTKEDGHEHP